VTAQGVVGGVGGVGGVKGVGGTCGRAGNGRFNPGGKTPGVPTGKKNRQRGLEGKKISCGIMPDILLLILTSMITKQP